MSDTANIAKINVGGLEYNIKDTVARDHESNRDNPHKVSKAQVELGNVDNLSAAQILDLLNKTAIEAKLGYTPANAEELANKIDKRAGNQEVIAIINFVNGININGATIKYDGNKVTFS